MSRTPAKPWHKRWHANAINSRAGLSLEEWGAYTILLDQMYDRGGPLKEEPRLVCAWLDCDLRVWKRLRAALVDAHGKLRTYVDEAGASWLVNDKVQAELGLQTYAELVANLSAKLPIANSQLSPNSSENPRENNDGRSDETSKKPPLEEEVEEDNPVVPLRDPASEELSADPIRQALDLWNETAGRCGLPRAIDLTAQRRKHLTRRLAEHGLDGWRAALIAVERSSFCRGKNDRKWLASLDFVLRPGSFTKLLEGTYRADLQVPVRAVAPTPEHPDEIWRDRLRGYRTARWWKDVEWGERPGHPACAAPAEILAEFGFQHERAAG